MENDHKELQLLPTVPLPYTTPSYSRASPWPSDFITFKSLLQDDAPSPSLDLQLSITIKPPPQESEVAAAESAYARRVMEMTRREMEMAQLEFARARHMWERAREEVEMVEKMKENAMRMTSGNSCMEITCQACRRKFTPN
uniref:protein indeterminate-domain 14-like n=1 Tax=Erigeron canadensis TaxID=72917 RepID=UPI001CB91004|nr:protein indeterminate-domain 14-like [Erigeron canadensis]